MHNQLSIKSIPPFNAFEAMKNFNLQPHGCME